MLELERTGQQLARSSAMKYKASRKGREAPEARLREVAGRFNTRDEGSYVYVQALSVAMTPGHDRCPTTTFVSDIRRQ